MIGDNYIFTVFPINDKRAYHNFSIVVDMQTVLRLSISNISS